MTLSELYEKQQQAERQVMNRLLLSQRIGKFINALAIVFIGTGLLLNLVGYDFVMRDGQLGIDTLEARQFLNEVQRASTTPR